jgi:hypothetical protein
MFHNDTKNIIFNKKYKDVKMNQYNTSINRK